MTKWFFRQPRADTENCRRQTGGKRAHCNTGKDGLVITFHDDDSDHHCHCHLYWYCDQVRYAQTDSHFDLQTNVSVITLRSSIKWWKHLKLPHIISNIKHLDWKWTDSFQFENSNYLQKYFQVIKKKILKRIDDSRYPCHRYVNRKGEFDIENQEINLVRMKYNNIL